MLFDKASVQSQLQTGGVITAVEVSRSGFGIREKHESFLKDYAGLLEGKGEKIVGMTDKSEKERCDWATAVGMAVATAAAVAGTKGRSTPRR